MESNDRLLQIERSIIKKFRSEIWRCFTQALNDYDLIQNGDQIAVCISGGKDSFLLAKCMQEIQKHGKIQFGLRFLVMDPGYKPHHRKQIEQNAQILGLNIDIFETDIFESVFHVEDSPCYLCARMRRGHLYKNAQQLGCNKIALGHHFDDVIETTLMNMLYGSQMKTMMPKLRSKNFHGMELIRPLYMVHEKDIIHWAKYNGLEFIRCACRFTEREDHCDGTGKRTETKQLIQRLQADNPNVEKSIFRSAHNVNLDTVIGYTQDNIEYDFKDLYRQKKGAG